MKIKPNNFICFQKLDIQKYTTDSPNFSCRYLSIIKEEGLQISQPAIDPEKSEVHYKFTARELNSTVHRYLLI